MITPLLAMLAFTGISASEPMKRADSPSVSFRFDSLGRLRSLREGLETTRWMARDLAGRALSETATGFVTGGATTQWHRYDGWRRVATSEGVGEKRFVFGRALDELLLQESSAGQLSPIVSHLGSTQKILNAAGSIAQQYKYDAFGAPMAGDTKAFSHLFAGAIYDAKAKLYDLRHRHYDPKIGRFLSRDPLGQHADRFNLGNAYNYVGNNPLTRKDPLGLFTMGDPAGGSPQPPAPHSILGEMLGSDFDPAALAPADRAILFGLGSAPELFGPSSSMAEPIPAPIGAETPPSIDELQTGLDIAGMTEPFGAVADGANALIYALRGQWGNAGLSGLAFIPLLGWLAGGSKIASKADNFVDDIAEGPGVAKCREKIPPQSSGGNADWNRSQTGGNRNPHETPPNSGSGAGGGKGGGPGASGAGEFPIDPDEVNRMLRQLTEHLRDIRGKREEFLKAFPDLKKHLKDGIPYDGIERAVIDFVGGADPKTDVAAYQQLVAILGRVRNLAHRTQVKTALPLN